MQRCCKCHKEKSLNSFHKNASQCKECQRSYQLRKTYGITSTFYNKLLKEQNYCCYICGKKETSKKLAVDHCHKTGKIRKLLCINCNTALGMVKENKETLSSMISYLMEHENNAG